MLKKIVQKIGGDPNKKAIEEYAEIVDIINGLEEEYEGLTDEELSAKTDEFKGRLEAGETMDDLLTEAFAVVREASKRTLGMRHYDVQLIGGIILHSGNVVEMLTGEGKTLTATLPMYLNALTGDGVHLVTVNDYLARRDARWMTPIFNFLGQSVGVLQMGSRTEGGKMAYRINLESESQQEDQHQMDLVPRSEAYLADITYGTNSEFGFDYLRDNMKLTLKGRAQRGHNYAIIDEVDNVLIDEARTPLIISGPSYDDAENYTRMAQVVKRLRPADYEVNEKDRTATLTELGETSVEQLLGIALRDPERPEDVTPEQARQLGFLEQAMRAQFLFKRNKDYLVQGGQVIIIDVFTGRLMPGRRWSDGLHQAVEAKEGAKVQSENITHATITIQNYFRMYNKLSGMTGTAMTEAEEFDNIYTLQVLSLPSNVEFNASREDSVLHALQSKDEYGYEYTYYAMKDDPENEQIFWKRKDYPDVVFRSAEAKMRAIVREIITYTCIGRPILMGTTSVENSERLSNRLRTEPVRKLLQTFLLRYTWMEQHDRIEDGRRIKELLFLNEPLEKLDSTQMRTTARDLGITLNVEEEKNLAFLLDVLLLGEEHKDRLIGVIKKGIPHQVLNARKHTEESQIIANAGAFGAVTIATNMAGRGVDIKLGGEIAEEIISSVNRILRRSGIEDSYDMTLEDRLEIINKLSVEDYGIYSGEINFFIQSMEDMGKVKELGGLHVIGSERHEARRIDNQLRGRAARQGDPGSSRFFLSMEDDLMRLFGGQQMDNMMQRLGMDDSVPLEVRMVSNIIESSQTRVEGANFDSRKHLLEYDDVLNAQRESIYDQRDRIFTKEDLNDDVLEMLQTEIENRIPEALKDEEGPWKLLGWLEQIQPGMLIQNELFPSFTYKLLLDTIQEKPHSSVDEALPLLLEIAEESLNAEEEHILYNAQISLELMESRLDDQLKERYETLDTFFETLGYADEDDTRSARELIDELSGLVGVPLKLSNNEQRTLKNDPDEVVDLITEQIENFVTSQAATRLIGSVERRLLDSLALKAGEIAKDEFDVMADKIIGAIKSVYETRRKRFLGENGDGMIAKQGREQLKTKDGEIEENDLLKALTVMTQEERTAFDKRTHKQIKIRTNRFNYAYHAAHAIKRLPAEELTTKVLDHLHQAQEAMAKVWGLNGWGRVSGEKVADLPEQARKGLSTIFGNQDVEAHKDQTLEVYAGDRKDAVITKLGKQEITEGYRQIILRVISDLWIEYLTQMEALRISIGLEAYAQRDPLVQYKTKASAMFQQLFNDMRMSVVTRMFTFRPRQMKTAQPIQTLQPRAAQIQASGDKKQPQKDGQPKTPGTGKRKRKRKRKGKKKN